MCVRALLHHSTILKLNGVLCVNLFVYCWSKGKGRKALPILTCTCTAHIHVRIHVHDMELCGASLQLQEAIQVECMFHT